MSALALAEDIEVRIETDYGGRRKIKALRTVYYEKEGEDGEEGEAVPVDFSVAEYAYDRKNQTLNSFKSYNRSGRLVSDTSYTWLQELHHRRAVLPSGYSYSVRMAIDGETDEWFTSYFSLHDTEGRPHGRCDGFHYNVRWKHGIPVSPHKLFLIEDGNYSEGRVYFFPLNDGYFLVDYFYISHVDWTAQRLYNIYKIGSDASPVGFVFGKDDPHMFYITRREDYIPGANRYFVPVDFVFQDHMLETADTELYARQKKAAMAFIDAQELPSEEYDKSARHYEMALECMERRKNAPPVDSDSDQDTIYVNART